jgi:hypothetical protein
VNGTGNENFQNSHQTITVVVIRLTVFVFAFTGELVVTIDLSKLLLVLALI